MPRINEAFLNLRASYLFAEVKRRTQAHRDAHPGAGLIDLGIGDVTLPLPPVVVQALEAAAREQARAETLKGYGPYVGYEFLRAEIATHDFGARGVTLGPDEIFVSDGGKSDAANIQELFAADAVVALMDPAYPVYADANVMAGRSGPADASGRYPGFVYLPCTAENDFQPALPERHVDLIYLCYPNNPTGAVLDRADLEEIAKVVERHDLLVISDEIYERLVYGGHEHVPFSALPGMRERTVLIGGFSKSYAMTGWRIGWVAAPAELMVGIAKVHQYGIMCAPTVAQFAALEALRIGEPFVLEMQAEYDRRRQLMTRRLNQIGLLCFEPRGAFYCFPNIAQTGMDDEGFAQALLHEERVAVVPGTAFGPPGADHVRMCYATAYEDLVEALDRIERFVKRHAA